MITRLDGGLGQGVTVGTPAAMPNCDQPMTAGAPAMQGDMHGESGRPGA